MGHVGESALDQKVDDQLDFVQAFEICHVRAEAGFHQGIVAGADQLAHAADQHRLFAEQIAFGLLFEAAGEDPDAGAANGLGVGERQLLGLVAQRLVNGKERRESAARKVSGAQRAARPFGGNHQDMNVRRRQDFAEVDVQSMGKNQGVARLQVGRNLVNIKIGHDFIRHQQGNDVRPESRFTHRHYRKAGFARLGFPPAARP